jgi:hypothetical protein
MKHILYIISILASLTGLAQPLERIYIHTDKDAYLAGEILWMKLYVVDATTHQPLALSRSAFVEILSDEQKPVLQARIPLDTGLGNGSFQLPFSLHSGNYLLRAYTNWMKNSPPDTWFEKRVTILNTLRNNPPGTPAATSARTPPYDIQFFPEGGSLIAGVLNHLAFHIVDSTGKGIACTGAILGDTGDTLVRFQTQRFGMGEFALTPTANIRYTAVIRPAEYPISTSQLPVSETSGYALHLADAGNGSIRIDIHAGPQTHNASARLLVYSHRLITTPETPLASGNATFLIPKDSLAEGVTWFTALAGEDAATMIPVGERGWFKAPPLLNLTAATDQPAYNKREKITLDLSARNPDNQPLRLYGSVAVVLQDDIQSTGDGNILNYLLLAANVKGRVESPDYYFSPQNPDRDEIANLLMMTQGWRKLHLQPRSTTHPYIPEYGGFLVSGRIISRQTGTPVPNIAAWLSAPGQHYQLARSISDKDGNIQWDMGDLYGARELVVQTASADSNYRVEITPSFADPGITPISTLTKFIPQQTGTAELLRHSIGAQAQNAYRASLRQQFTRPAMPDTTEFYGRPDKRYRLDDYTRYTTMEEVFREYVKEVRLRDKKGGFEFYVQSDQANQFFFDEPPLVLMDGVPTTNANNLIRYDPLKMQKIEVVAKRYFVGGTIYDGIVSCSTYQGDISGFTLDGNAYTLDYDGWQLHREFYSPVYDTKDQQESRIPDLRNVLYWSGDILTDQQGKQRLSFYSSDMPGRYQILLQGITADGKTGSAIGSFTVRN